MEQDGLGNLFDDTTEIKFKYRRRQVIYTYRHPSTEEWLAYQRRAASFNVQKKLITATDDSMGARIWLHEKMRVKVEVVNGSGERVEVADKFPPLVQEQAVIGYLSQVEMDQEEAGN